MAEFTLAKALAFDMGYESQDIISYLSHHEVKKNLRCKVTCMLV